MIRKFWFSRYGPSILETTVSHEPFMIKITKNSKKSKQFFYTIFDKKVIWAKSGLKIEISMSRELCNKKTVKISAATVFLHSFIKIEHHMGYGR